MIHDSKILLQMQFIYLLQYVPVNLLTKYNMQKLMLHCTSEYSLGIQSNAYATGRIHERMEYLFFDFNFHHTGS